MKKTIIITIITLWMGAIPALYAGEKMQKMGQVNGKGMQMGEDADMKQDEAFMKKMPGKLLLKKEIDGYTVHFYVMKAMPDMEMGGSHDFMIKVKKDGAAVKKLIARSKVIHPNGKAEQKMMMVMGYWYMSGYDLGHEGQHQLMALFKTADGAKHFGGIYFPEVVKSSK